VPLLRRMDKQKVKTGVVLVFPQKRIFFYTLPVGKFDACHSPVLLWESRLSLYGRDK